MSGSQSLRRQNTRAKTSRNNRKQKQNCRTFDTGIVRHKLQNDYYTLLDKSQV